MSDEILAQWANELLQLIEEEGTTRAPKIRNYINKKRKIDPQFEKIAMTLILLKEGL